MENDIIKRCVDHIYGNNPEQIICDILFEDINHISENMSYIVKHYIMLDDVLENVYDEINKRRTDIVISMMERNEYSEELKQLLKKIDFTQKIIDTIMNNMEKYVSSFDIDMLKLFADKLGHRTSLPLIQSALKHILKLGIQFAKPSPMCKNLVDFMLCACNLFENAYGFIKFEDMYDGDCMKFYHISHPNSNICLNIMYLLLQYFSQKTYDILFDLCEYIKVIERMIYNHAEILNRDDIHLISIMCLDLIPLSLRCVISKSDMEDLLIAFKHIYDHLLQPDMYLIQNHERILTYLRTIY